MLLRCAIDVSNYKDHINSPVAAGINRNRDYQIGLMSLNPLMLDFPEIPILFVDNTLDDFKKIPHEISELIPPRADVILTNSNRFGIHNKGAGDFETIIAIEDKILKYDYILVYEGRLKLIKVEMIRKILNHPSNYLRLENKNFIDFIFKKHSKVIATGIYCLSAELLVSLAKSISLGQMVDDKQAIESLYYKKLVMTGIVKPKRWGWISLRREVSTNSYEKY